MVGVSCRDLLVQELKAYKPFESEKQMKLKPLFLNDRYQ